MDIRFQRATIHTDVEFAAYARKCLLLRMQHRSERVERIEVGLGDAGARAPGRDSHCILRVKLQGAPAATVVVISADMRDAIDRATDRLCRLVDAQLRAAGSPPAKLTEAMPA